MTNKEDGDVTRDCNSRMAAMLAVHLVSQVLDEAYIIANAAKDSGQPWRNLSMLKNFKTSRLGETDDEDLSFEEIKGDCDLNENKIDAVASAVATSTPQKPKPSDSCSENYEEKKSLKNVEMTILHHDATFIGQGDEDMQSQQNELTISTSMYINHLFDMSDVERIVVCDETEVIQCTSEPNHLLVEAVNKTLDSYVNNTLLPLDTFPLVSNVKVIDEPEPDSSDYNRLDYSFTPEAFIADINRDVTFYIDNEISCQKYDDDEKYQPPAKEIIDKQNDKNTEEVIQKNDVAFYENAYATLNRDYDQGSEVGFSVCEDDKGMKFHEVKLITADTSEDDLSYPELQLPEKPNETAPTVSGVSCSRKSNLAQRCRTQGARLLACIRGWWRRKIPGKRKESRCPGAVLGMCPLSPDARRRASSLVDNRLLRSLSPSRPVIWKFNTVNEALVNSNRWKEYTFDSKPEDCG